MNPRFRSQARQSPFFRTYWVGGALACVVVFFLFYRSDPSFKTRVNSAAASIEKTVQKDLSISRTRLLQQIHEWNAKVNVQGLHSQQIHIGDHVGGIAATATVASMASSSGSSSCACEKAPPDPRWRMKTAKEVEAEAPELVAALKKSAINNEVMLALGESN